MSGFSAEWLALREPYDARARNVEVLEAVAKAFADRTSVTVVDLACGTGATLRAIGTRLPARQAWRLVDNDLSLLARVETRFRPPELKISAQPVDLARDLELAFDAPLDLVATSALLDLVSTEWLDRLVVEVAVRKLPLYAALNYDGRIDLDPELPFDGDMIDAVNRHQRRDKGFGPALGPDAVSECVVRFGRVGYEVTRGASDWAFGPEDVKIQDEVLTGWADAAQELGDVAAARIESWLSRRRKLVRERRASMRVGHTDFFAFPTATR